VTIIDVPLGVVTVMSIVAAASGGEVAVIEVSELTVKLVAATFPKFTRVAPVNADPVIVTDVPPPVVPEPGLTPPTDGTAAFV